MKIVNEFTVNTPIDRAWALLTDLEQIAPCMPGAQLTAVEGDVYQGKVKVKVGPVISEFTGTARFTEKDDQAYRGVIDAKGRDARSAGNAAALVVAQLTADGDKTLVSVDTDLKISGKLAQFGAGMIKEISGKLLAQFVTNLETKLAATDPVAAVPVPVAGTPVEAPAEAPIEAPAETPVASAAAVATAPAAAAVAVAPSLLEAPSVAPAVAPAIAPAIAPATAPAVALATDEPEALDLLGIAGGSIYKRLLPLAAGVVVVGAVIAWFVARRR
jgi:carbon monoxide dehydrogenase subunit G